MISGTITDAVPHTQWTNLKPSIFRYLHAKPLSVGLNCALGAKEIRNIEGFQSLSTECAALASVIVPLIMIGIVNYYEI